MNEHSLRVLEFDKVLGIVADHAASEPGRTAVLNIVPATILQEAEDRLAEAREFMEILRGGETPPLDGILDVGQAVEKLGTMGSVLSPAELLNTATTLRAGRRVRTFFQRYEGKSPHVAPPAPHLFRKASVIRPLKQLEDSVFAAIDERAEVRDSASPDLRKIRRQIDRTRDDILSRMSAMLQDGSVQKIVQDPLVTIRDDRYVLPLKPNFRQALKGVVHGQSGSRATLFVEPLEILDQNNRLAELRLEEHEEIQRILRELTSLLAQEAAVIGEMTSALAGIDEVYARARFGLDVGGTVPVLSRSGHTGLRMAKHPLLVWTQKIAGGREVAPNDIEIPHGRRALILSGPNAGGKTVILKTVGLLALMAQAGLPVTAAEGSELPCFSSVFADIGDEQSLEQNLSTYSSHVSHIADFLRKARRDSLVLLDELGSGTDPVEGAGLGAAVLDALIERGCVTLVTTHHNALKLFGSQKNGAVNAAMEFDPQTLEPTYRLTPGRPGRSYGLDMAARIGMPGEVIRNARSRIGKDDSSLEDLLKEIEAHARRLDADRKELAEELNSVRQDRQKAEAALIAAREEARNIRIRARTESREILASLRHRLRELSRDAAPERTALRQKAAEVESLARTLSADGEGENQRPLVPVSELHPGDRVRIPRWNKAAVVLAARNDVLELEVDGKKLKVSAREAIPYEPLSRQRASYSAPGWSADLADPEGSPDRLNIIGFRIPEALAELERFIDRTAVTGLSIVTIIHGLGTGALKTAVTDCLRNHPLVSAIRSGEPAEGGGGVTVAELRT